MPKDSAIRTIEVVNEHRSAMAEAINKALEIFCCHSELTFAEVMLNGLSPIADAIDVTRIIVYRYVEMGSEKRLKQMYRWDKSEGGQIESLRVLPDIPAVADWLGVLQQDLCINRRLCDMTASEAAFLSDFGVKSFLMVPVFTHSEFWGCLALQDHVDERVFDDECVGLMRPVAYLCANAVIRDEIEREIADKNEFNHKLFETAPVGLTMFDESFNVIDCNETILAICGVTRQYYMDHHYDLSPEYQPDGMKTTEKLPDALKRVLSGEKLVMEWLYQSNSGEPIPCEITLTRIKYGGKYISMAYVYDLSHIKKMEESIQLLKTEAEKIYFDALTGIRNRRYFDENQDRVIKTLSRSGGKLSLMMIDIDFFKNYNDTYGHKDGDNCLRMVADTLEKCVTRTDDFIARYGGEEFVVVLPNTDQKGACVIAKKLLKNMRELKIPHAKSAAADYVTVSIGVTTGAVSHTQDMDDYVRRADEMLYKSKQNGRNKYSFKRL